MEIVRDTGNFIPDLKNDANKTENLKEMGGSCQNRCEIRVFNTNGRRYAWVGRAIISMDEIDGVRLFAQKLRKFLCDALDDRVNGINHATAGLDGVARNQIKY